MSLPNYLKAEQAVLASVFLDNKIMNEVNDKLLVTDFFDSRHRFIYTAMLDLYNDNQSIDYASVFSRLEQAKTTGKAGGIEYIMEVSEHLYTTSNLDSHINLVLDASLKREMIEVSSEITKKGYQDDISAKDYIDESEAAVFKISQKRKTSEFSKLGQIVTEVREILETRSKNKGEVSGLKTGFSNLDKITNGLQPEELIILAARPSMGKSAFALNIALNVAKKNKSGKAGVAIFSLEMSNDQLASRMIANQADVPGNKLKSGFLDSNDWASLTSSEQILKNLNIFFDDSAAVTISDVRAKCRKLKQEDNLEIVIIDYLQLIKPARGQSNRQEQVAEISRGLKQMARELKVPVIALSQLSRSVETRDDKKPVLADLRESGSIEQDADIVLFLYREDYYVHDESKKTGDVELSVAKNRQGQSGITLHYKFEPSFSRFIVKEHFEPSGE
ncbi:replicative DNA helicase [Haploplasma modicum]|uniref:replicative DNA helicase n=1 Tax=Haploplasma modicum TaxID=2150 RepID=UPI00047D95E7|nr:replicative DNA helicase [Haploplasma modicum]